MSKSWDAGGNDVRGNHLQSNRMHAELHSKMQEETTKTFAHGSSVHQPLVVIGRQAGQQLWSAERREVDAVIDLIQSNLVLEFALACSASMIQGDRPELLVRIEL